MTSRRIGVKLVNINLHIYTFKLPLLIFTMVHQKAGSCIVQLESGSMGYHIDQPTIMEGLSYRDLLTKFCVM